MNLPPDVNQERAQIFKEFKDSIEFSSKTCKSKIYGPAGYLVWEESEEDYQTRMNELFYEVK